MKSYKNLFAGRAKRDAKAYSKLAAQVRLELDSRKNAMRRTKRVGGSKGVDDSLRKLMQELEGLVVDIENAIGSDDLEAYTNIQDILQRGNYASMIKEVDSRIEDYASDELGSSSSRRGGGEDE